LLEGVNVVSPEFFFGQECLFSVILYSVLIS
jgi:hypothetical protein